MRITQAKKQLANILEYCKQENITTASQYIAKRQENIKAANELEKLTLLAIKANNERILKTFKPLF